MEIVVVVAVVLGLFIIKMIVEGLANAIKGIFGFIARHFFAIVFVLVGCGLLWGLIVTSPDWQRWLRWKALEDQHTKALQPLIARRAELQNKIEELRSMEVGPQGNTRLHKIKPFETWKKECSQSRDSRVTEDKWRKMYLAYLSKQASFLLTGSESWPGLEVRIRKLQEDANAFWADFKQSHSEKQEMASSAEEVSQ